MNKVNIIFDNDIKNYGQLVSSFEPGMSVFAEHIEEALLSKAIILAEDIDSGE